MTKEERIYNEKVRLAALFEELDRAKFFAILGLIEMAAFMKITLDDLAEEISKNGTTDHYVNGGNQSGEKVSAQLSAFNKTCALYEKVTRQLMKELPYKAAAFHWNGRDEHEHLAFQRFKKSEEYEYYLSDDFKQKTEDARAKVIEMMLQGN